MRPSFKLELDEARQMIGAAIRKSGEIGVLETVCITDEGGYPLALERMDGARVTGPQIAWNKASPRPDTNARPICSIKPQTDPRFPATRRSASSGALKAGSPSLSAAFQSWLTTWSSAAWPQRRQWRAGHRLRHRGPGSAAGTAGTEASLWSSRHQDADPGRCRRF